MTQKLAADFAWQRPFIVASFKASWGVLLDAFSVLSAQGVPLTAGPIGRELAEVIVAAVNTARQDDATGRGAHGLNQTGIAAAEQALFTAPVEGTNHSLVEHIVTAYLTAAREAVLAALHADGKEAIWEAYARERDGIARDGAGHVIDAEEQAEMRPRKGTPTRAPFSARGTESDGTDL